MMLYSCVDCIHKDFVLFSEEKGTCLVTLYETPYLALLCTLYGLEMSLPMETGNLVQNYDIIFFILWSQQTLYFLFCRLHQTVEWHCEMIATCFIRYFLTRCVFCKKKFIVDFRWICAQRTSTVCICKLFEKSFVSVFHSQCFFIKAIFFVLCTDPFKEVNRVFVLN